MSVSHYISCCYDVIVNGFNNNGFNKDTERDWYWGKENGGLVQMIPGAEILLLVKLSFFVSSRDGEDQTAISFC